MKKIQKVFLLLAILVLPFMVTGCGKNSSAKDVAVQMVTKLSKDDYKNIGKIFYQEKDSYFDEEAFKKLIQDKELNISGNKTIKVREVGEEITDSKTGYSKVEVKIAIDDNKIFNVDTIKVGNKWYVYEPDFYDGNIEIAVPSGTTVKFNGKTLNKSLKKTKETDTKVYYPDSYRNVELEDVKMDIYKVKNVIAGKYSVAVKGKDTKEIKDVVYTYSKSGSTSDNYDKDTDYSDRTKTYTFKLATSNKDVENYVKNYLDNVYSNASTGSFDGVAKYFDSESDEYNNIKKNYESLAKKAKKEENSYSYISDFKVEDLKNKGTYYYDDNNIVVMVEYNLTYKMNYSSSSYDRKYDTKSILVLKKDSKEKYVITNGYNIFVK